MCIGCKAANLEALDSDRAVGPRNKVKVHEKTSTHTLGFEGLGSALAYVSIDKWHEGNPASMTPDHKGEWPGDIRTRQPSIPIIVTSRGRGERIIFYIYIYIYMYI